MEYQNIEFGDVEIEGKDRYPEYRLVFPEKPVGKTILDVGCNLGYYCLQSHWEGAKYCLGVDDHIAFIESADDTKQNMMLDDQVKFVQDNIITASRFGDFDIVLLLFVVHHFTNIIDVQEVIQRCHSMSKELTVFGVLDCTDEMDLFDKPVLAEWLINSKGNKKLALSKRFFRTFFPDDRIEVIPSTVEGRSIIKVWK